MENRTERGLLSDGCIDEFLSRAEARLKGLDSGQVTQISSAAQISRGIGSRLTSEAASKPYVFLDGAIARADPARFLSSSDRRIAGQVQRVEDPGASNQKSINATSGAEWFNMPKTVITPELKRDLQLLKMRSVLDPRRHYKKEDSKTTIPKFSQMGTIIEGPTDFYSSRLQNRERKRTLTEEVMRGESSTGRFKSTYDRIQSAKTSGKKAHYKTLKAKRIKGVKH